MKLKIIKGHTNISYKIENNFVQKKVKNGLNHMSDYNQLVKFDFVPKLIENNSDKSIWEWIDGLELTNPDEDDLKKIADILKIIHHSNIKLAPFNLSQRIKKYRKILKEKNVKIDVIEKLYKKINLILRKMNKTTPIHGDIWQNNVLKTKTDKLFLIDWEYSHMGDIHFELAYIIESFKLNKKEEETLLSEYHDYNPIFLKNNKILVHYLIVLWLYSQDVKPFSEEKSLDRLIELNNC